jgi:nucleoside-diphosphate-sugar epimerase
LEWLDYVSEDIRENIDVFASEVRHPNGVRKVMEGCDMVYHLAALIVSPYSYYLPDTYVDINVI